VSGKKGSSGKGTEARYVHFEGIVQGVGFRPLVYRLAVQWDIKGWVLNSASGLEIWAEGSPESVEGFIRELTLSPPPLARILRQKITLEEPRGFSRFEIRHSDDRGKKEALISPDVAICPDCYREINDPQDRRYGYPFTNCTNCGPRYTIVMDIPYDRENTTMRKFPMCARCRQEYEDPLHRRFHAQPNACPDCGPQVELVRRRGEAPLARGAEALAEARRQLKRGAIVAVKGLGGFHLACNAASRDAVKELRARKQREYKPFAVMARDTAAVRRYCRLSEEEEKLLKSPAAPIVILDRQEDGLLPVEVLCPGINTLGVMLPYTPLHCLLFDEELEILVMTSANLSDDPLVTDNEEAFERLAGIADFFLLHNRDIFSRCDDSVVRWVKGDVQFVRRARGYVPFPVTLPLQGASVLACGSDLKNTFCLTRGREAYLSQHLGDLEYYGNCQQFYQAVPHLMRLLQIAPEIVAYDLHPEYASSRYGRSRGELKAVEVQHHHAHMASCLAENQVSPEASVLGVICDGTGWGADGAIWGFEFLLGGYRDFRRAGHLAYLPLLGGEESIRRPQRMAYAYLLRFLKEEAKALGERFLYDLTAEEMALLDIQYRRGFNSWPTSSCGRLFDAVSAWLGICSRVGYEGQAAVELETAAENAARRAGADFAARPEALREIAGRVYPARWEEGEVLLLDPAGWWEGAVEDFVQGVPREVIALRFHLAVAEGIVQTVLMLAQRYGFSQVALSGGTFQNRLLFQAVTRGLEEKGFTVLRQRLVPPNDGGLSLGQAAVALAKAGQN